MDQTVENLRAWLERAIPGARNLRLLSDVSSKLVTGFSNETVIDDLAWTDDDCKSTGFSNETVVIDVAWMDRNCEQQQTFVLRTSPLSGRGLLAPYDVARQFHIMRCLDGTAVPVPKMLWLEESPEVLGRPFFIMAKVPGYCFDAAPAPPPFDRLDSEAQRALVRRAVEAYAAIANVDWHACGIDFLGDGGDSLTLEIERWVTYGRQFAMQDIPGFQVVLEWLRANQPSPNERIALVHGDAKWGNIMWDERGQVVAVNDWELTSIGDPLMDLGYLLRVLFVGLKDRSTVLEHTLTRDEVVAVYAENTGLELENLEWYEVLSCFKLAAIVCRMQQMFDTCETDELRFATGSSATRMFLSTALQLMDEDAYIDLGLPPPRGDRIMNVFARTLARG
jgi:aminoglycoside phosphotransferase (APT) family kinase protein